MESADRAHTPMGAPKRCRDFGSAGNGATSGGSGTPGPSAIFCSAAIVMSCPLLEDQSQMRLGDGNQPVQAFASDRSDHPFADRVGHRAARGRFQAFSPSCSIDPSRLFVKMRSRSWIRTLGLHAHGGRIRLDLEVSEPPRSDHPCQSATISARTWSIDRTAFETYSPVERKRQMNPLFLMALLGAK